jgi:type II secretory pathway component PulF
MSHMEPIGLSTAAFAVYIFLCICVVPLTASIASDVCDRKMPTWSQLGIFIIFFPSFVLLAFGLAFGVFVLSVYEFFDKPIRRGNE